MASLDQNCFRQGTYSTRKELELDPYVHWSDFADLDKDKRISKLELSAYLMRNAYLFCRKTRANILKQLDKKEINTLNKLFELSDTNLDSKISTKDVPNLRKRLDID